MTASPSAGAARLPAIGGPGADADDASSHAGPAAREGGPGTPTTRAAAPGITANAGEG